MLNPIRRLQDRILRLLALPEGHPDRLIAAQIVAYVGLGILAVAIMVARMVR